MVYKFFDKKSATLANKSAAATHEETGVSFNSEIKQLAEKLENQKKEKSNKICSSFKDITRGADLADIQSIKKYFDFYYILLMFLGNIHGLLL